MAQGLIYMVDADGSLRRMTPSAPENEDKMQALVASYPELISDGDGDLLLIRREQSLRKDGVTGLIQLSDERLALLQDQAGAGALLLEALECARRPCSNTLG